MSFSEILMKLAEKKALEGDVSMAYSLMAEAEEAEEKEKTDESLAEMIKRGKDAKKASTLDLMIKKYAGFDKDDVRSDVDATVKGWKAGTDNEYNNPYDENSRQGEDYLMAFKAGRIVAEEVEELFAQGMSYDQVEERMYDKYYYPQFYYPALEKFTNKRKDAHSSTLNSMINKYAGKRKKSSYKDKIKSMDGFMKMEGKAFCFDNNAQAKKALAVAEQAANFLNWQVVKGDGCYKLMEMGMDKKANVLEQMIHKYAGEDEFKPKELSDLEKFFNLDMHGNEFGPLPQELQESIDEAVEQNKKEQSRKQKQEELNNAYNKGLLDGIVHKWRGDVYENDSELLEAYTKGNIKGHRSDEDGFSNVTSNLKTMIKKYAKEDLEISGEEAYEPFGGKDVDLLKSDDVFDAMGRGFEDGMRHPDYKKNPYKPEEHDDDLYRAYENGFESALDQQSRQMSRGF